MIERFDGAEGRRVLVDALCRQRVVGGARELAEALADSVQLKELPAGAVLLEQHGTDNDLYFILLGEVSVQVNGREIARRQAEHHVGEMTLIDPKTRRSATIVALSDCVVARVSEPDFSRLAQTAPDLWRNLAMETAERLRQRNDLVRRRNDLPHVFVGSSVELLSIANAVQAGLARDPVLVRVWTNGVFGPSDFAIEALEREAIDSDFAVLVLGPDDRVLSRRKRSTAPRDNVVLELGLFIGAMGHQRVYLLTPHNVNVKIPTDVLGVTPIRYTKDQIENVCKELRTAINRLGPR